jgi:hypothetical protein
MSRIPKTERGDAMASRDNGMSLAGTAGGSIVRSFGFAATLCALAVLGTGCLTPGQRLEPQVISQIHDGMSRDEVHRLVGRPGVTVSGPEFRTLDEHWFLFDRPRATFGFGTNDGSFVLRDLHVLYSASRVVEKFRFHEGTVRYDSKFAKVLLGTPISPEALAAIQKGTSTRAELEQRLGPPASVGLNLEGLEIYVWIFVDAPALGSARVKELLVTLNDEGVVQDFVVGDSRARR